MRRSFSLRRGRKPGDCRSPAIPASTLMVLLTAILASTPAAGCGGAEPASPQNTICGTPQNDSLVGTSADDRICGLAGDDTLKGGAGSDELDGGPGNDTLIGGAGMDSLYGSSGNDVLRSDTDLVAHGGNGSDSIYVVNTVRTLSDGTLKDSLLIRLLHAGPDRRDLQLVNCGNDSLTIAGRVLNKSLISRLSIGLGCETVRFSQ